MNAFSKAVLAATLAGFFSAGANAALSTSDMVGICKARAATEVPGAAGSQIKLLGMARQGQDQKLRLKVMPANGTAFVAVCAVSPRTGEVSTLARADGGKHEEVAVAKP